MLEEELAWFCILCAGTGLVLLDVDEAALVTVIPVWILMITDDLIDN